MEMYYMGTEFGACMHEFLASSLEMHIKWDLGDWTEHFGIYPYRKSTNASK
jgi:hypothetical protein